MQLLLSHSWEDKSLAMQVKNNLEADGHQVWMDIMDLIEGDAIQPIIDKHIGNCDAMVLLWSKNALKSGGVTAEIESAQHLGKRIIPLLTDDTQLHQKPQLDGLLGVPSQQLEIGCLLLRRALLLLMIPEEYRTSAWFAKGFDNVKELGGYLKYIQTYRLPNGKNEDGYKEDWVKLLEKLKAENEDIRQNMMAKTNADHSALQTIMVQLEKGNNTRAQLEGWLQWCNENENAETPVLQQLIEFIKKDIDRLSAGGAPVRQLDNSIIDAAAQRLSKAIGNGKAVAEQSIASKISKFSFGLLGAPTIKSISSGLMNYVICSPQVLQELSKEANCSEYVAVKESLVTVAQYLETQDHNAEAGKQNLEGYFDDAYLINNTAKLLLEANLITAGAVSLDFVSTHITDKYFALMIPADTKQKVDKVIEDVRSIIGLKKKEINWGMVAAVVVGGLIVAQGVSSAAGLFGSENTSASEGSGGESFEDKVSDFTGKYGGGLSGYTPIDYGH